MAGMNTWGITGNLTRDPELRHLPDGKAVCNMGVAVNGWKDGDVQFVDVSVWGKGGEACAQHLNKGSAVGVVGTCKLRTWDKQDGSTGFGLTIPDGRVNFLGGGKQGGDGQSTPPAQTTAQTPPAGGDDDIPF